MLVRKCCIFNGVTYGHDSRHPGLAHSKTLGSPSTHYMDSERETY